MHWKIYYDNGTASTELNSSPYGVICIVIEDKEVGKIILHRWDYYVLRNNVWYGHHLDGLLLEMLYHADEITCVKAGRTIDTEVYQSILNDAFNDKDFPVKSAKKPLEAGNERVK